MASPAVHWIKRDGQEFAQMLDEESEFPSPGVGHGDVEFGYYAQEEGYDEPAVMPRSTSRWPHRLLRTSAGSSQRRVHHLHSQNRTPYSHRQNNQDFLPEAEVDEEPLPEDDEEPLPEDDEEPLPEDDDQEEEEEEEGEAQPQAEEEEEEEEEVLVEAEQEPDDLEDEDQALYEAEEADNEEEEEDEDEADAGEEEEEWVREESEMPDQDYEENVVEVEEEIQEAEDVSGSSGELGQGKAATKEEEEEEEEDPTAGEEEEERLAPYSLDEIDRHVQVRKTKDKGRCLYSRHDLEPGEVVFVELPVLVATPDLDPALWAKLSELNEEQQFELPPVWHLAALCSLTTLGPQLRRVCFDKWVPDLHKPPSEDVLRVLDSIDLDVQPPLYERMLQAWRYNSFGHHTKTDGLVLYNRISMMSHSCHATACWHYGEGDAFVLRARSRLKEGDELSISYIGDDDLFKSTRVRREKLTGWMFTCHCRRCDSPVDTARGFRCPVCSTGTMFFSTSNDYQITTSTPCTVCQSSPDAGKIKQYVEFEEAYIARLDEIEKDDLEDALLVLEQANRVFTQHWVMFSLHTILLEGYRDIHEYDAARIYQNFRIAYATQVMPQATYTLAWLYEELGDGMSNQISTDILHSEDEDLKVKLKTYQSLTIRQQYEEAYTLLSILCGKQHHYTAAVENKLQRILDVSE